MKKTQIAQNIFALLMSLIILFIADWKTEYSLFFIAIASICLNIYFIADYVGEVIILAFSISEKDWWGSEGYMSDDEYFENTFSPFVKNSVAQTDLDSYLNKHPIGSEHLRINDNNEIEIDDMETSHPREESGRQISKINLIPQDKKDYDTRN
jgi:hypothetical protein